MKREELQAVIDQAKALQESYQDNMRACTRMLSMSVILAGLISARKDTTVTDYLVNLADDLAVSLEVRAGVEFNA